MASGERAPWSKKSWRHYRVIREYESHFQFVLLSKSLGFSYSFYKRYIYAPKFFLSCSVCTKLTNSLQQSQKRNMGNLTPIFCVKWVFRWICLPCFSNYQHAEHSYLGYRIPKTVVKRAYIIKKVTVCCVIHANGVLDPNYINVK